MIRSILKKSTNAILICFSVALIYTIYDYLDKTSKFHSFIEIEIKNNGYPYQHPAYLSSEYLYQKLEQEFFDETNYKKWQSETKSNINVSEFILKAISSKELFRDLKNSVFFRSFWVYDRVKDTSEKKNVLRLYFDYKRDEDAVFLFEYLYFTNENLSKKINDEEKRFHEQKIDSLKRNINSYNSSPYFEAIDRFVNNINHHESKLSDFHSCSINEKKIYSIPKPIKPHHKEKFNPFRHILIIFLSSLLGVFIVISLDNLKKKIGK